MSFFFGLFGGKRVAPERVPTDTVIPMYFFDDSTVNRKIMLHFSMRFDDVLDVDKVVGAAQRLLEKPGWRKLGARLRQNETGKLEYHVPAAYTKERPAINSTHATHDMPISSHPQGRHLPSPGHGLGVTPDMALFASLIKPENLTSIDDFLYSDRSQLHLHVVSFNDVTLVTLTWLHTLWDALGRELFLNAWVAMLEGRDEDVPEFYGYDVNPLATLGEPVSSTWSEQRLKEVEEPILKPKLLKGWRWFLFVFNFIWEQVMHREETSRELCIPASFWQKVRQDALEDLKTAPPEIITWNTKDPNNPVPFVSDSDILAVWTKRLQTSNQPWVTTAKPTKMIQMIYACGIRHLLSTTEPQLIPKGVAYIANCVTGSFTMFTLSEILSTPLGHLAARMRKDLNLQTTRPQVDASFRLFRESGSGYPPIFGQPDMQISAFSNWTKGKMFDTDFSTAVLRPGAGKHRCGRPTYIQVDTDTKGLSTRDAMACIGKDGDGNYWVSAVLRKKTWENIERALEGMS